MKRYWFRQRRFGMGGYPITWEGWALSVAYVVLFFAGIFITRTPLNPPSATFIAYAIVVTTAFCVISWRTTEGGWRWRWGNEKD